VITRSRANGPGLRAVVWVQGCSIRCPGCANQHLLSHRLSRLVDPVALARRLHQASPAAEGLTLSGGEPFDQPAAAAHLLATAQDLGWSTVVFTGYRFEPLLDSRSRPVAAMLQCTDLLIDGPYIDGPYIDGPDLDGPHIDDPARADTEADLLWRGSANQRLLLLSSRYSPEDLRRDSVPREEILVTGRSPELVRTGFLSRLSLSGRTPVRPPARRSHESQSRA
jgi:anaerobic ribonucleoside-triphosphate reductase activating protein